MSSRDTLAPKIPIASRPKALDLENIAFLDLRDLSISRLILHIPTMSTRLAAKGVTHCRVSIFANQPNPRLIITQCQDH